MDLRSRINQYSISSYRHQIGRQVIRSNFQNIFYFDNQVKSFRIFFAVLTFWVCPIDPCAPPRRRRVVAAGAIAMAAFLKRALHALTWVPVGVVLSDTVFTLSYVPGEHMAPAVPGGSVALDLTRDTSEHDRSRRGRQPSRARLACPHSAPRHRAAWRLCHPDGGR